VDVRTLQAWLGHTELATTQVYLHYAPQPGASALLGGAFATPASILAAGSRVGSMREAIR
jgi:hypothetical protein